MQIPDFASSGGPPNRRRTWRGGGGFHGGGCRYKDTKAQGLQIAHKPLAPDRGPCRSNPIWFALDNDRPLAFFAGIWTRWTSIRKVREGEVTADLFGFLTTEPNAVIATVHQQAMPAILSTEEERDIWLRAPWSEACALQRSLPDGSLGVVLRGEKQDGPMELVNLAAAASAPHAAPPLPLLDGTPDHPNDAATVALRENINPWGEEGYLGTHPGAGAASVNGGPLESISIR